VLNIEKQLDVQADNRYAISVANTATQRVHRHCRNYHQPTTFTQEAGLTENRFTHAQR
jgi:hypothetical protein